VTVGLLQLVLIRFPDERQTRPIAQELNAMRKSGLIRLVDMMYLSKDPNGELKTHEISDLAQTQKAEYGYILNGLLGLRKAYATGGNADEIAAAMSQTPGDFKLSNEQVQKMAEDIPIGGAAMLILFEHLWAIKFKEACLNAGGQLVTQGLLSPEAMAFAGTTLEDAVAASKKMREGAVLAAAATTAVAAQKLSEADAEVAAKQAEAARILTEADAAMAVKQAEAQRMLDEAEAALAEKQAEAQRLLDEADAQAAAKIEEGKVIADAAIAAGVRSAAEEMKQAEELRKQAERDATEHPDESKKGPGPIFQ
jgi:uncharacterized membrane protein